MIKTLLFFSIFFSLNSFAGGDWVDRGNGGFAIQCDSGPLQTLDLHEQTNRYKWTVDAEKIGSAQERVSYLIAKIEKFNPRRAALYQDWFKNFFEESEFISNMDIERGSDLGLTLIPKNCEIFQTIYQRQPSDLNKFRYTIAADLWNQLSTLDQAALILHELIYREFSLPPNSQTNSEISRKFNAWVNSTEFNGATLQTYLEQLQAMYIVKADYHDLPLLLAYKEESENAWKQLPLYFNERGGAVMVTVEALEYDRFQIGTALLSSACNRLPQLQSLGMVGFDPDGRVHTLQPLYSPIANSSSIQSCAATFVPANNRYIITGRNWMFNYDGNPVSVVADFYGRDPEAPIIIDYAKGYHIYLLRSKYPIELYINLDQKTQLKDMRFFNAQGCLEMNSKNILIKETYQLTEAVVWDLTNLEALAKKLPVCD